MHVGGRNVKWDLALARCMYHDCTQEQKHPEDDMYICYSLSQFFGIYSMHRLLHICLCIHAQYTVERLNRKI